jgi:hypothetical protein
MDMLHKVPVELEAVSEGTAPERLARVSGQVGESAGSGSEVWVTYRCYQYNQLVSYKGKRLNVTNNNKVSV